MSEGKGTRMRDTAARRSRPARRARALGAALLVTAVVGGAAAAPAAAAGGSSVRLPVLPSKLAPDDPCTAGSTQRATAVPWEQAGLQLNRAWQVTAGEG